MISDEKIREIRKMLRAGEPQGEIKESLIREGYSKEDIDKAFKPHRYDMRSWYLISAIALLLFGFWLYLISENFLILILSSLMFYQYYRETVRLKNNKTSN